MSKEDQIKKWLNNELTSAEKKTFEQGEDFALYKAIVGSGKQFKASNFSKLLPITAKSFTPSLYNSVTIACPIPLPPPLIMTFLFSKLFIFVFFIIQFLNKVNTLPSLKNKDNIL